VTRRLWLAFQILLAGLVVIWVANNLASNWIEVRAARQSVHLHPWLLAASAIVILATYALLVAAWRGVLLGWNERLAYPTATRIWTVSNLGRYVPGKVWQIAGMAALAQRAGVSAWAAAGSAVIVQLLAVATGTLITVLFAAQAQHAAAIITAGLVAVGAIGALAVERPTAIATAVLRRLSGRSWELRAVRKGPLVVSAAITLFSWIAYGLMLYLFIRGLLGVEVPLGVAIGAFTASYLLGLIAVFAPGGVGVRDFALYALLSGPVGPGGAIVVSFGSRILMTVTELLAAAVSLLLTHRRSA